MFKSIDLTRPWPNMGMTTEKWKQIPALWVPLRELIATQDGVKLAPFINGIRSWSGDPSPHVISWRGNLYLEDGHHRAVKAAISGQPQIFARVLTIID